MEGWIKLHRKILNSDMYRSLNSKQRDVMITLLLMANHKTKRWEHDGKIYEAKPGQMVTSLKSIQENCASDVSIQNIRTALDKLKSWGFLTWESTNKNRLVTIINWAVYQGDEDDANKQSNNQLTSHQQTTNNQLTTNKNEKNDKNIVPTEQPDGWGQDPPNKKQIIAEMVAVYRSIPGVKPRKADYPFLGQLFNEYGPGEVYGAIKALERKMESGPVRDTYSYLRRVAEKKYEETKAKVTPLRRHPEIPPGYNMPSLEDLERQRQVEAEMEAIRQERMRRRREMNGA